MAVADDGTVYAMGSSDLLTIDPLTGLALTVDNTGFTDVTGLAYNPADGLLYAVQDTGTDSLWTPNPTTLQVGVVGKTGLSAIQILAFHPDGALYAYDIGTKGAGLVTLDTTTGLAPDPFPGIDSLDDHQYLTIRGDGKAFVGSGNLYSIDLGTGIETLVGSNGHDLRIRMG